MSPKRRSSGRRKVRDEQGNELDATFEVEGSAGGLTVRFRSRGGTEGSPGARNRDYNRGLETLLTRLGRLGAVLEDSVVESTAVQSLSHESRRLALRRHDYPLELGRIEDMSDLRKDLARAQAQIGRAPDARGGGNMTKTIRLWVAGLNTSPGELGDLLEK